MEHLLDASELGAILGMSPKTIIKNSTCFPDRVPPSLKCGTAHGPRRWRPETVRKWLEEQEFIATPQQKKGPGRPTKRETIEKQSKEVRND